MAVPRLVTAPSLMFRSSFSRKEVRDHRDVGQGFGVPVCINLLQFTTAFMSSGGF